MSRVQSSWERILVRSRLQSSSQSDPGKILAFSNATWGSIRPAALAENRA